MVALTPPGRQSHTMSPQGSAERPTPALAHIPQETAAVKAASAWVSRLARALKNCRVREGDGSVALSLSPNPGELSRPHCRVLLRPGSSLPHPASPEIRAPMPADEKVARVLGPDEFAIDTNALLAA
jgi:hypothetical protein